MRRLIVNADDLGATEGVNRGIVEAHECGIVTSASLMVDRPAAAGAVELCRWTRLSLGLHAVVDGLEPQRCEAELERQLARFDELVGDRPTHLDSHHHLHREPALVGSFAAFAERERLPLRDLALPHEGRFYGDVAVERLLELLDALPEGDTELGCHPGYPDGLRSRYTVEREKELRTLTDGRVRARVRELEIELIGWRDLD